MRRLVAGVAETILLVPGSWLVNLLEALYLAIILVIAFANKDGVQIIGYFVDYLVFLHFERFTGLMPVQFRQILFLDVLAPKREVTLDDSLRNETELPDLIAGLAVFVMNHTFRHFATRRNTVFFKQ